jgi:hypothetical protein
MRLRSCTRTKIVRGLTKDNTSLCYWRVQVPARRAPAKAGKGKLAATAAAGAAKGPGRGTAAAPAAKGGGAATSAAAAAAEPAVKPGPKRKPAAKAVREPEASADSPLVVPQARALALSSRPQPGLACGKAIERRWRPPAAFSYLPSGPQQRLLFHIFLLDLSNAWASARLTNGLLRQWAATRRLAND